MLILDMLQIGLLITLSSGQTSVCGSTMLSNTRSVTAAHCWNDGKNQAISFTLVFGSAFLFFGGTRVSTSNVQMHGSWNPHTLQNDVAMINFNWVSYTSECYSIYFSIFNHLLL